MKRSVAVRLGACAAVALAAACGSPGKTATTARPEDPSEVVRREPFPVVATDFIFTIARDETHLYWVDGAGLHRRPLGDADAGRGKLLTAETTALPDVTAMVIAGDRVYLSDGFIVYQTPVTGGAVEPIAAELGPLGQPVVAIAPTAAGDLVIATFDSVLRVPEGGTAATVLADGQVRITSLAIDGDHAYWTDYGEDPAAVAIPASGYYGSGDPSLYLDGPGVVRRVALRGGPVAELATAQRGPWSIAVSDGRVWWANDRGPGVQSAPVAGGAARVEVRGRFDRLARDDHGLVVKSQLGLVSEWSGGTTGDVRMTSDGRWMPTAGKPIVLTDDWAYVMAMHPYEAHHAVVALPRQDEPADVVAAVEESIVRVRAHDGVVWWLGSQRGGGGLAIAQRDPASGEPRRLATHQGWVYDVAAGDGELYFSADDAAIYRVTARGLNRFASSSSYPVAVTVHRNHVFWCDGNQLMAKRRKGGQPFPFAQFAPYGNADIGSDVVFDDDFAYLIAYGGDGQSVFRIDERGQSATVWSPSATQVYPQRDLVAVAGELFFTAADASSGLPQIYRLGPDGEGTRLQTFGGADRYVHEMVAGGGFLYVTLVSNDVIELVRVDASTGDMKTVLRWQGYPNEPGILTADESGAYVGIEAYDAVIRIAHDAPGVGPTDPLRLGGT